MGCRLWGGTESDTTEATWQQQQTETTDVVGVVCDSMKETNDSVVDFLERVHW